MTFDEIRWHKDMWAHIDVHTLTRGVVRMAVKVVGVNFETSVITLTDGERLYHRTFEQIELIED